MQKLYLQVVRKINLWKVKINILESIIDLNIFLYRIDGKFNKEDVLKLNTIYGSDPKYLDLVKYL